MNRRRILPFLAGLASTALLGWGLTAGNALASHPTVDANGDPIKIQLFTYEEVGNQLAGGNKMPVQVDPTTMRGFPYSPKQTCGGCHDYNDISRHAFHSSQGFYELNETFNATSNKPWTQSAGMFGKW
ncbi:MAG: cytochrome c [Geothermobacteraceae bacterium]